jgi:hypothetical protein
MESFIQCLRFQQDNYQSVLSLVNHIRFSVKESKIGWTMS